MNLSQDEIIENFGKHVDITIEILFFHMNMNLLVLLVDSTQQKENMNFQKFKTKYLFLLLD